MRGVQETDRREVQRTLSRPTPTRLPDLSPFTLCTHSHKGTYTRVRFMPSVCVQEPELRNYATNPNRHLSYYIFFFFYFASFLLHLCFLLCATNSPPLLGLHISGYFFSQRILNARKTLSALHFGKSLGFPRTKHSLSIKLF